MAATNVGSIYYTVEADTQAAIDAAADMNTSLESMQKEMAKTDFEVRKYAKSLNTAGSSVSKFGVVVDELGNINVEATQKMQRLMAQTDALNQRSMQFTKTTSAVRDGLGDVSRGAGQAGIQLQQFVGQLQGGQDPMLALSQQSADLGFVLGAPLAGAVVGIAATFAGVLIPALIDSEDATEELEKATERLSATFTLSSSGVVEYSNKMQALAKISQSLTRINLEAGINEQQAAMESAAKIITDTVVDAIGDGGLAYKSAVEDLFGQATDEAYNASFEIKKAAEQITKGDYSTGAIENLSSALNEAKEIGLDTTAAGRELIKTVSDMIITIKDGEKSIDDINKKLEDSQVDLGDTATEVEQLANKYANLVTSLKIQADTLGMTRAETLEYNKALALNQAALDNQSQETINSIASSYDRQIAFARETEATKAQTDADKKAAKAKKEAIKADQDAFEAMDALREADKKRKAEQANIVSAVGGASDAMGLGIDTESRLQELQALHDAELISEQEFNAQKLSIMQNYNQQVMALNEERFRQESEGNAFVMDSLDALGNASTNVFSGMLSGTMSATDAVRAFGNAIMNEAINALVQMGIQQLKNQIIGKSVAAANVATAAASGAAMAAAYAPAATAAAIATQGGAVTAGMTAVSTATPIMNTILATGRQYGGPVSSNGMYRINENGAPEVFNAANGQQYMLPNTRGEVVSNKDASGGGTTNIIVNVSSDGSVSTNGSGQMAQFGKEIGQMVEVKYKQMEAQSMRQGGSLWRAQQKG